MAGVDIILDQTFSLTGTVKEGPKKYNVKPKKIHSALNGKHIGLTSLKSLVEFLPLVKSKSLMRDLVVAFWDAAKYIFFEVICETTTRVLERLAVLCFSPRIAWKLVRDVSASITRMAVRGVSGFKFIFKAVKMTFLGNLIGALSLLVVRVGLDILEFFVFGESDPDKNKWEKASSLGKKILGTIVTIIVSFIFACICGAVVALIFGSIGTWLGAFFTLPWILSWIFCPAMGQAIGFAVGGFVGDALVSLCLEKLGL